VADVRFEIDYAGRSVWALTDGERCEAHVFDFLSLAGSPVTSPLDEGTGPLRRAAYNRARDRLIGEGVIEEAG
jgi:hypothetical protein